MKECLAKSQSQLSTIPVGKYLFKVNNNNTGKKWEICLKLTILYSCHHSGVFIVNFELTLHLFLVFL